MAGSSLLALIDDIATILDDVSVMTKVAAKKTSGVLGDDLALNAQQVAGVPSERELPIVWKVAVGSLINKCILVPAALLMSAFLPGLIQPALIAGGLFLCFEGAEKVIEKLIHLISKKKIQVHEPINLNEADKIKGAIRTDFILSAEIIVITLGSVAAATFVKQVTVLVAISILMTIGVYGLVALIVKLDDIALYLCRQFEKGFLNQLGRLILKFAPYLMKSLGIVGTAAMFLVGGGILSHAESNLHHYSQEFGFMFDLVLGFVSGSIIVLFVVGFKKLYSKSN